MKGSEIVDPGHLIGLKPRRFPNWGARQQPIKICPLCYSHSHKQNKAISTGRDHTILRSLIQNR